MEQVFFEAIKVLREVQSKKHIGQDGNWMHFYIHNPISVDNKILKDLAFRLEPYTRGLGLLEVNIQPKSTNPYAPPKILKVSFESTDPIDWDLKSETLRKFRWKK